MTEIQYRWMEADEVTRIGEIDRSEQIRINYEQAGGELKQREVNWDSPAWQAEGDGAYTVTAQIRFCREHLKSQGRMVGAFDGDRLVGVGIVQHEIREKIAQLAYLHVSNGYRRKGIGERISKELTQEARRAGAKKMYVSATPSGSAVGFYLSFGFRPVDTPIPELFELEPDDIHMMKDI